MKDTVYFRHDYDAQTDPKMIKLRVKYGREGYGLFRGILEAMRSEGDIQMYGKDMHAFAFRLQYEYNAFELFINFCVEIGLLVYDEKDSSYYSKRLQSDAEYMRNKSKKAKQSANARWKAKSNANALRSESDGNAIKDIKDSKIKDNIDLTVFVEKWNSIKTIEGKKGLPKVNKITDDLRKSWNTKLKSYSLDEIKQAVNNYCIEISQRKEDSQGYLDHRFTLMEFLKQSNGLAKFINLGDENATN